jgi:hypothetical protein
MIKFFTNKELSQKFNVNLAKFKRWSREFLPPDPLGGLQSGYARQYNPDEAFTVILGGHLVGDLKFTIPDARQIIQDLNEWLAEHEFYFNFSGSNNSPQKVAGPVKYYQIAIIKKKITDAADSGFIYRARGIIADDVIDFHGDQMRQLHFTESCIGPDLSESASFYTESHRVLNISALRDRFLIALAESKSTD